VKQGLTGRNGFTLIELVVTVGIVGILAAIAIPAYTSYMMRSNRTDAVRSMTLDAQALERCYSQQWTYVGCTVPAASLSSQGYYTIAITYYTTGNSNGTTPNAYTITATPVNPGPQLADSACQMFTLDSFGHQGSVGSATSQTCWGSA